jgi:predicted PurR-regulated permease PerM
VNDDYFAGGPLVWLLTMVITTLLLVASAQALWLVVPLLIAIILYYALYPVVRRLSLSGMSREAAAALAAGGLLVIGVLIMIPVLPWLAAQTVAGEETLYRYLEGGRVLIDRLLGGLEKQFAFLRRLDFHAEMGRRLGEFGDTAVQK